MEPDIAGQGRWPTSLFLLHGFLQGIWYGAMRSATLETKVIWGPFRDDVGDYMSRWCDKSDAQEGWYEIASTIGVKKGNPPSLTLFGIYIDGISTFIDRGGGCGASLSGLMVALTVMIDDSQEGLQRCMDALEDFCTQRGLIVNLGKPRWWYSTPEAPHLSCLSFLSVACLIPS